MKILLLALLLVACVGCMDPIYPVPPPPGPPPTPPPVPPPVPPPTPVEERHERSLFEGIKVGDPASVLDTLPSTGAPVMLGKKAIHSWVLDEPRSASGYVRWEVHVADGKVVASFDW